MRILVIGASGQLGTEFMSINEFNKFEIYSPSSNELDITSYSKLNNFFNDIKPDIVLNFSAYTDVEKAEKDSVKANNINNLSILPIVKLCNTFNSFFIHISTDYVFGGESGGPYSDKSITSPINTYGKTKDAGEKNIIKESNNAVIIRTASLYGLYGINFFKKFISKLQISNSIDVISDHSISITNSYDLAMFIYKLIIDYSKKKEDGLYEGVNILHIVNRGYTNWFEISNVIVDELSKRKIVGRKFSVNKIKSMDWVSLAKRPNDSRLKLSKVDHLHDLPYWEESLRRTCRIYLENNNE